MGTNSPYLAKKTSPVWRQTCFADRPGVRRRISPHCISSVKLDASHYDRSDNMKEILTLSRSLDSYTSIKECDNNKDEKKQLSARNKFGYNSKLNLHLSRSHRSGDISLSNTQGTNSP